MFGPVASEKLRSIFGDSSREKKRCEDSGMCERGGLKRDGWRRRDSLCPPDLKSDHSVCERAPV